MIPPGVDHPGLPGEVPLNPEQRAAVTHDGGPLLVLAPAGSGKTRVVIERLLSLMERSGEGGERFFVATFTRKAAGELVDRISRQHPSIRLPWVGTFHSLSARLLRQFSDSANLSPDFTIFDSGDQKSLVREKMKRRNIPESDLNPVDVLRQIGRWKNARMLPGPELALRLFGIQREIPALYDDYEKGLHQNRALDYDDLLLKLVALLSGNPDVVGLLRDQFHHILVDEYQDTNPLQEELIRLLSRGRCNVTVVGDDDQSIYRFRGADIGHIRSFGEHYPGARRIVLSRNYRSTPSIVSVASSVISRNPGRYSKEVVAVREGGAPVFLRETADEEEEARFVAGKIREWVLDGGRHGDSAVLFRTNAQGLPFEKVLAMEGIPYFRKGGGGFLDRKEIRDLLAYLRVMANPFDRVGLKRLLNVPARGQGERSREALDSLILEHPLMAAEDLLERLAIGARSAEPLRKLVGLLRDGRRRSREEGAGPGVLLEEVLLRTDYRGWVAGESQDTDETKRRVGGIEELLLMARQFARHEGDGREDLSAFLEEIALSQDDPREEREGGRVALMTIHQSKGLEFDQVFVVGVEDQILPIRGRTPSDIEEERRLFYVAMTRARARLFLTWCQTRRLYGKSQSYAPSPFLRDIPEKLVRGDAPFGSRPGKPPERAWENRTSGAPFPLPGARTFLPEPARNVRTGFPPPREELPSAPGRVPRPEWIGRLVQHPRFGPGTVIDAYSPDPDLEMVIRFDDGKNRTLLARVANLTLIGG